jgi:hypothetical protein
MQGIFRINGTTLSTRNSTSRKKGTRGNDGSRGEIDRIVF